MPIWNFDGSSTGQADGHNSDTFLIARAIYKDPFRRGNHVLVMCDTFKYNMEPTGDYYSNITVVVIYVLHYIYYNILYILHL